MVNGLVKDQHGDPLPETAVYVCEHCGAEILDNKPAMLRRGNWIAAKPLKVMRLFT